MDDFDPPFGLTSAPAPRSATGPRPGPASLGGTPGAIKDGLTGDQRVVLAFAHRWRRLQTDAARRQQIATDTHAPGAYRTDTDRNLAARLRAYDVKPTDKLYLGSEQRARIWGADAR